MLTFSQDPDVAEQQMCAIIVYLTAFGYIDGDFDLSEKLFVRELKDKSIARRRQVEASVDVRSKSLKRRLVAIAIHRDHRAAPPSRFGDVREPSVLRDVIAGRANDSECDILKHWHGIARNLEGLRVERDAMH